MLALLMCDARLWLSCSNFYQNERIFFESFCWFGSLNKPNDSKKDFFIFWIDYEYGDVRLLGHPTQKRAGKNYDVSEWHILTTRWRHSNDRFQA